MPGPGHIFDVQIPEVNPSGATSANRMDIQATPAMFGGFGAQAGERLGTGLEHAGEEGMGVLIARAQLTNEIHASELNTWLADKITDRYSEFTKLEGRSAQMALPQFKKDIDGLFQDSMSQTSNLAERAAVARTGRFLTDNYYRYGTNHANQQFTKWQDATSAQRAATYGNQAAIDYQNGNLRNMEVSLNTSDDEVSKRLEARGFDQDTIKQEVRVNRGKNLARIIEAQADNDPVKASQLYRQYEGQMDAASSLAVKNKLRSALWTLEGHRAADEETGRVDRPGAPQAPVANVPASFLRALQREEGFDAVPRWDVKQWTVGYGTRATGPDERPSREDLDRRFADVVQKEAAVVDAVNPHLDAGTRAALISLTHNTGDAWTRQTLGDKIRAGDLDGARQAFLQYNNVAGQPNAAIAARRWREAQWFGQGEAPAGAGLPDKQVAFDRIVARTANNPAVQAAALARMGQIYSVAHQENLQAGANLNQRVADTVAEADRTGAAAQPLTANDFVAAHGPVAGQEQYAQYQETLRAVADKRMLASMPPDQVGTLLGSFAPQSGSEGYAAAAKRQQLLHDLAFGHDGNGGLAGERKKDPAAYGLKYLPAVQEGWSALQGVVGDPKATPAMRAAFAADYAEKQIAEQQRLGTARDAVRIVPQDYAKNIVTQLTAAANDDDPARRAATIGQIQREAQMWGRYWPQVMGELGDKATPLIRAIAADVDADGHPMHPDAMTRLLSLKPTDKVNTILGEAEGSTKEKDLRADIATAFHDFRSTLMPRQLDRDYPGYADVAEKLAALHVRDGDDSKTAATKAFNEVIGDRYEIRDTWRMPKDAKVSADEVQAGTLAARGVLMQMAHGPVSAPTDNLEAAKRDLNLTSQEEALYRRHLTNLTGPGGVDNADGSRSTLYQTSFEQDGRTYNVPTVWDGKILPPRAAIERARSEGLDKFPSYGSEAEAEARYAKMHQYMERDTGRFLPQRQAFNVVPFRDNMGVEDNRFDSFVKFARDGRFVTSPNNDGLNLYYVGPRGAVPVRTADGRPLLLKWGDLAQMGRNAPRTPPPDWGGP